MQVSIFQFQPSSELSIFKKMVDSLASEIYLCNILYEKSITYHTVNTEFLHYKEINVVWVNTSCLF